MTVRPIVQLKDPFDSPTRTRLGEVCTAVVDFGPALQSLVDDLLETLGAHRIAVGLAASQIGFPLRVAVVDLKVDSAIEPLVLVNPMIKATSGKKDLKKESCMSVPHFRGPVERRNRLLVQFMDRRGCPVELHAEGFLARVIAHEVDHMDGKLYLDRMTDLKALEPVQFFQTPER